MTSVKGADLRPASKPDVGHARLLTLAALAVAFAFFLGLGVAGWPGMEPNGCRIGSHRPTCFCERPHEGLLAQPTNSLSNLGFMVVGLAIAWASDRRWLEKWPANPMTRTRFFPTVFAATTALLGPGSMFLHASLTREGGLVDVASMYLFASLLIAYAACRWRNWGRFAFSAAFLGLSTALITAQATVGLAVEPWFGSLLGCFAGLEWLRGRSRNESRPDARWLWVTAGSFGLGFAIWLLSLTGGPWCDPDSWLQGHGAWHVLCAAAAGALFLYFASETSSG